MIILKYMRKKNYRRKKRGPVVSKKITVDGIKFASGLEAYNVISKRTGKMVNGTFVKDAD